MGLRFRTGSHIRLFGSRTADAPGKSSTPGASPSHGANSEPNAILGKGMDKCACSANSQLRSRPTVD